MKRPVLKSVHLAEKSNLHKIDHGPILSAMHWNISGKRASWSLHPIWFVFVTSIWTGCNLYPPVANKTDLNALTNPSLARQTPDCAQCHAYPLKDAHHVYHLLSFNAQHGQVQSPKLNGPITCMDCHFSSVSHFSFVGFDTLWVDAEGNPVDGPELPTDRILSINPMALHRPIPADSLLFGTPHQQANSLDKMNTKAISEGEVLAWLTGSTHQNNKVDVSFPPNNALYPESLSVMYRPKDLSCSMVACHQNSDRYRWANPRAGTGSCPSLSEDDSACIQPQPLVP
jgi:hypothetical protein